MLWVARLAAFTILAASLAAGSGGARAELPKLALPLDCDPGKTCMPAEASMSGLSGSTCV